MWMNASQNSAWRKFACAMCNVIRRHHCTFEKIRPHQLYWPTCCRLGRCQVHFAWQSFYYASHLPLFRWKSSVLKRIKYTLYDTKFLQSQVLTRLNIICDSALFLFDAGGGVQPVERQICDDTIDGRLILHVDDITNTASRYCGSTYHILLVQ